MKMKERIILSGICIINFMIFVFPWFSWASAKYSFLGILQCVITPGIIIELLIVFIYMLLCTMCLFKSIIGKKCKFNIGCCILAAAIFLIHISPVGISSYCTGDLQGTLYPGLFLLVSAIGYLIFEAIDPWGEIQTEAKKIQEIDKAEKEEEKKRLRFEGKYTRLFYRIVWKNFKSNWKDYILFLFCTSLVTSFVIFGYGLQTVLGKTHNSNGLGLLSGLNEMLFRAMIPLAILSVFIIVVLFLHYVKCRAKNFGVFLTIGMRRKTLYYFIFLEFLSVFILSLLIGTVAGRGLLHLFVRFSSALIGEIEATSLDGGLLYIKSVGTLLLLMIVSYMAAHNIFTDFNVGQSTDLSAIAEKMPLRFRKIFIVIGIGICVYCGFMYSELRNFENIYYILGFFSGTYFVVRYGLAEILINERKRRAYIKKLMVRNQLFHKSNTNTGYILVLSVLSFCIMFFFTMQIVSVEIAEDMDVVFPYDIMCIADDGDDEFFERLQGEYSLELVSYPMVRVCAYDATEEVESREQIHPLIGRIQSQNIGISESTYHSLKQQLDPSYKRNSLDLDAEGNRVYIVHQQDKSVKAQPIDFFLSRKKPVLFVGQPYIGTDDLAVMNGEDVGYRFREVAGEEIEILTGAFRQGLRENLVVFSDEYFEKAQELWKTTNIMNGTKTENKALTRQGPTKLVLIRFKSEDETEILSEMKEFQSRHTYDESYDVSVLSFYTKQDGINMITSERVMKITMNGLVIVIFSVMYFILIIIKMLSEIDSNRKRALFLNNMGMRKREWLHLLEKEYFYYYYFLPIIIGTISAAIFTIMMFIARMYNAEDILHYLKYILPLWGSFYAISLLIMWIQVTIYARKVEVN